MTSVPEEDRASIAGGDWQASADYLQEAHELVLAIAHEIGNLASAVRIQAHLLDESLKPLDLAAAAVGIDELSARQGAWLALLRPLLQPRESTTSANPEHSIQRAEQALREGGLRRVSVDTQIESGLPSVALPPLLLQQLLILAASSAAEAARPDGHVILSARVAFGQVEICVADDGSEDPELREWRKGERRGRVLGSLVTAHLVEPYGGRHEVRREDGRTQALLSLDPV